MKCMFAAGGWFARLAFDPLPDLRGLRGVGENDKMFMRGLGNLLFNFPAHGVFRQMLSCGNGTAVGDHAALLGDRLKCVRLAGELDFERRLVMIPAEFVNEQGAEVEAL